jgi:hypothetical protein
MIGSIERVEPSLTPGPHRHVARLPQLDHTWAIEVKVDRDWDDVRCGGCRRHRPRQGPFFKCINGGPGKVGGKVPLAIPNCPGTVELGNSTGEAPPRGGMEDAACTLHDACILNVHRTAKMHAARLVLTVARSPVPRKSSPVAAHPAAHL